MSGEHFCFASPDDPEPLECEQCAVFAERADYWRDAAEKRSAWLDAEMDRRRAAEAEVERLRDGIAAGIRIIDDLYGTRCDCDPSVGIENCDVCRLRGAAIGES